MKKGWIIFLFFLIKVSSGQVKLLLDPLAFLEVTEDHEESSLCHRHLGLLQQNLANPLIGLGTPDFFWPQMMADATGKIPDGIAQLNLKAYGNAEECINIEVTNPGDGTDPFIGRYITFAINSYESAKDPQKMARAFGIQAEIKMAAFFAPSEVLSSDLAGIFGVGVCVPDSCSELQIKTIIEENYKEKLNATVVLRPRPSITKYRDPLAFDVYDGVMIGFLAILAFLVVTGTLMESFQIYKSRKGESFDNQDSNWSKFFLGFGVYNNSFKWLNTSIPKGSGHLGCLDGIRFISMTWVVLGHAWGETFSLPLKDLASGAFKTANESFWSQAIINAFPSVDSFFLISGTLLSYLTLKELHKTKGKINIALFYMHRYLRLSGTYFVIIAFHASLMRHLKFGPVSEIDIMVQGCREEWWKNMLYINNFGGSNGENFASCIGQTWYLANDFQMFLISPLFIWPLWKLPKLGLAFSGVTTVISIIIPTVLTVINDWPATVLTLGDETFFEWNYVKPWCRFSPYIIGILLGYILYTTKDRPVKINPIVTIWLWVLAFATGFAVIYGLDVRLANVTKTYSAFENAFYGGFHRAAWALALSWLIFSCCRGYGGWINDFLSWGGFIPLSRISYIIYLMHFVVIYTMKSVQTHFIDGNNTYMTIFSLDVLVFTSLLSAFIFVFVEMPWLNTEKLAFSILLGAKKKPLQKVTPAKSDNTCTDEK